MVLAGPLFLLSQTRAFYQANREPLLRLGLGTLSAYLGLMLLSKSVRIHAVLASFLSFTLFVISFVPLVRPFPK
jgi:hypothetical protein